MSRELARQSIRTRLLLSMGFSVVLGASMTGFVFVVASGTIATLADRTAEVEAMEDGLHTLEVALFTQESFVLDYALSGRDEVLDEFEAATQTAVLAYADLRARATAHPQVATALEAVHATSNTWREEWAEPFLRSFDQDGASDPDAVEAGETLFSPVEQSLVALDEALTSVRRSTAEQVNGAIPELAVVVVPFGIGITILLAIIGAWLTRTISGPLNRLNHTAAALVAGQAVSFQPERDDEVGALAGILERLREDVGSRYDTARRDGEHAAIFNRLAELTSFASDEQELVEAAVHAIRRLTPADHGDILLANPSQNRLMVGVAWGENARAEGSLVEIDRIDRCPGIRRAAPFIADDLADAMVVRCPAHAADRGTVACVPMSALGKMVGVIHIEHAEPRAYTPEAMQLITRVAESVGLAMANARLMKTMEGQAMTDPLTGLRNARFFDPYLQQELESGERDDASTSVIMLDLDHFKEFNDAYGHPAGDEALRSFSRVLGATIRSSDVAARYGGEEFIIALRHAGPDDALQIAEKIRLAVEQMVVEIGPGRYGRITVSQGVASTTGLTRDMRSLVALADAALYRAKEAGRNRVETVPVTDEVTLLGGTARRRRGGVRGKDGQSVPMPA